MHHIRPAWFAALPFFLFTGCEAPLPGSDHQTSTPIIGGEVDEDDLYPQVVAIYFQVSMTEGGLCTGTVIHDEWVLTAGHCPIDGYSMEVSRIFFGNDMLDPQATTIGFDECHVHPDYGSMWGVPINDVALLHLEEPSPFEPTPIHRDTLDSDAVGELATFIGFGLHDDAPDSQIDGLKRFVDIEIADVYPFDFDVFYYEDPDAGTSNGDSGGPALFDFGEGPRVIGVTSWGFDQYGVSMAVDAMADWIDTYTGGDSDPWDDDDTAGDDDTMADDDTGDDDVEADDDTGVEVESEVGAGCSCRSVSSRGSLPLLAPIAMLALWMRTLRARRTARRG